MSLECIVKMRTTWLSRLSRLRPCPPTADLDDAEKATLATLLRQVILPLLPRQQMTALAYRVRRRQLTRIDTAGTAMTWC